METSMLFSPLVNLPNCNWIIEMSLTFIDNDNDNDNDNDTNNKLTNHFKCNNCEFRATNNTSLKKHIETHNTKTIINRNTVDTTTKANESGNLKQGVPSKIFTCESCEFSSEYRGTLNYHVNSTHKIKLGTIHTHSRTYKLN